MDEAYNIGQFDDGSNVTLTVTVPGGNKGTFTSYVILNENNDEDITNIDVSPFVYGDKVLGFSSVGLLLRAEMTKEGRYYQYTLSKVDLIRKVDGTNVHRLYSKDRVCGINKRGAVRVSFGVGAVMQLGEHRKALECIIKNISSSGMAIIMKGRQTVPDKRIPVDIVFSVVDPEKMGGRTKTIRVRARVMREVYDEEKDDTLFGVQYLHNCVDIDKIIMSIQRAELAKVNHDKLRNRPENKRH